MDASQRSRLDNEFLWVERVSTLMDSKFSIGGFRFGLDPILGLFPIVGQGISFATALLLVLIMYRHGANSKVATKMLLNVMLDAGIGAIPLVGNVFDFFFKANKKNIRLLKAYHYEGKHQGSAKNILAFIFILLLLFCVFIFYLLWITGEWLIGFF